MSGLSEKDDPLTRAVIGAAITVHRTLGPGLLESAYQACLCQELSDLGLSHRAEVPVAVEYKGKSLDCGYRIDILVEEQLVLELKAVEKVLPIHEAQLLTYMKLARKRRGLLFNFHSVLLKDALVRRVL